MEAQTSPSTRIYVLLARSAETAVVFRRGPSKQVQMWKWNRANDRFERGQWLHGRVFERRCDLSPNGELLCYFAAKHKGEYPTYTVVSRPPYFSALALFPGMGTWGGGGLFDGPRRLRLNHSPRNMKLARGFRIPKGFSVERIDEYGGRGENYPIEDERMIRDGWVLVSAGEAHENRFDSPLWIEFDPPRVYARHHPKSRDIRLEQRTRGIGKKQGPRTLVDHAIVAKGSEVERFAESDWADWDVNGDLLLAQQGAIFRAKVDAKTGRLEPLQRLIDLSHETFENVPPPPEALRWPWRG